MSTSTHSPSISSERRNLGAILTDKRPLQVPPYQRSFSWTKNEIADLWDDLQGTLNEGEDNYFLGSMVFISKPDNFLEVVDGQQRLATISLFLAAIRDGFKMVGDKERAGHVEIPYLCSRDLKTMQASPKLLLNEVDNDIYSKIIESSLSFEEIKVVSKNKELPESNRLVATTYVILYELVQKKSGGFTEIEYLSNLVEIITDNILCIQIITNSEDSAYVLFETLNDRGIDLTLSDLLKNFLFSKAGTRRLDEVKHKWIETTTLIGQEYMKSFIRHEWMSRFGQTREKELYKKIKDEIRSTPKVIDYVNSLKESAIVYDAIRNSDHEIWSKHGQKCRNLLEEILLLGTVQCYPLIMSTYFAKSKELETVLRWIVNLTIRYSIIGGKGTGNLETTYARASSTMRKDNYKLKDVKEILLNIWPNDDEFKTSFNQKTLTTPKIIRHILAKIEIYISGDDSLIPNPESLTVEHILPKRPGSEWPTRMRSEDYLKEHCNRIGNLTILTDPMNRDCESKGFDFKKGIYKEAKYKLTTSLCKHSEWNEDRITERQTELADIAAKIWVM